MTGRKVFCVLAFVTLLAGVSQAADVTGKWEAEYSTTDQAPGETKFAFKQDGGRLTGTVTDSAGELAIQEGTVSGDAISFVAARKIGRREVKLIYTGKVTESEISFSVEFEGARPMKMVARRVR